jgi:hypothetical protein
MEANLVAGSFRDKPSRLSYHPPPSVPRDEVHNVCVVNLMHVTTVAIDNLRTKSGGAHGGTSHSDLARG